MGTAIFDKFPRDGDFDGKKVLNLGCGFAKYTAKNVTNLDAYEVCKPDVVCDLESGKLPFEDESYDIILANHILEHVKNWWSIFEECSRIVRPGGAIIIYVPGPGNDSTVGYRDHISQINHYSFFGTLDTMAGTNAWAETNKKSKVNQLYMEQAERRYYNARWIQILPKKLQFWVGQHLRNVISEEGYFFRKIVKGETRNGDGNKTV